MESSTREREALFDEMTAIRRAVVWYRVRDGRRPPRSHHSFVEHESLVAALAAREPEAAAQCMRRHLDSVRGRLIAAPRARSSPSAVAGAD